MVRISDARMSGTAYGCCVLHVAPESWVGGPLARVESPGAQVRARLRDAVLAAHPPGERVLRFRLPGRHRADAGARDSLSPARREQSGGGGLRGSGLAARDQGIAREHLEAARCDDPAISRVRFVVSLEIVETVDVVHHQPGRAAHSDFRGVPEPVQLLEASAVPEMKARYRIQGLRALFRVKQVVRA